MIKIRPLTFDEQLSLPFMQGTGDVRAYLISRTLLLSEKGWPVADIALALKMSDVEVQEIVCTFNQHGLASLAPGTKAFGRSHLHGVEYSRSSEHLKTVAK